jgi:hypothetical protein
MADTRPIRFLDQQVGQQRFCLCRGKVEVPVAFERCFKWAKKIEGQARHVNILTLIRVASIRLPLGYSPISPLAAMRLVANSIHTKVSNSRLKRKTNLYLLWDKCDL